VPLVNVVFGRLVDLWLVPVRHLPPIAGLVVCSVIVAVVLVLVFKATADQPRLRAARRQLQGAIFEMRLFRDDPGAVIRALGEALRHQGTSLRLISVPLAVSIVLLAPVVGHLHAVYGYEGLQPGRPVLVTAQLREGLADGADVTLEVPAGIGVETSAVWIPATREVLWRLTPVVPGSYTVHVVVAGVRFSKALDAAAAPARRSPVRTSGGVLDQLRNPVESRLPDDGPLVAIRLTYPERRIELLGWRVHWAAVFLAFTLGAAIGLSRRLRVRLW
jgi:hypothetical protein